MDCQKIKKNLEIKRINNLISCSDYMNKELQVYLSNFNTTNQEEEYSNTETFKNSEIIPNDISVLFKKPWSKLPVVHQIIKIKEYCKKINNNKVKCLKMEKVLINKVKTRKLKAVNYNEENGYIISINDINDIFKNL